VFADVGYIAKDGNEEFFRYSRDERDYRLSRFALTFAFLFQGKCNFFFLCQAKDDEELPRHNT
jgi:hypothetical protein